jgi:hypothetical protein
MYWRDLRLVTQASLSSTITIHRSSLIEASRSSCLAHYSTSWKDIQEDVHRPADVGQHWYPGGPTLGHCQTHSRGLYTPWQPDRDGRLASRASSMAVVRSQEHMRSCQELRWCLVDYPIPTCSPYAPASDLIRSMDIDVVHGIRHVNGHHPSTLSSPDVSTGSEVHLTHSRPRRSELDRKYRDLSKLNISKKKISQHTIPSSLRRSALS